MTNLKNNLCLRGITSFITYTYQLSLLNIEYIKNIDKINTTYLFFLNKILSQ